MPDGTEGTPPPNDLDAEAAVLSAVLVDDEDSSALREIAPLRPADFYSNSHARIFQACLSVAESGQRVDIMTVGAWLKEAGRLAEVGGTQYLATILDANPVPRNVGAHAAIVRRAAHARAIAYELDHTSALVRTRQIDAGTAASRIATHTARLASHYGATSGLDDVLSAAEIFAPLPAVPYVAAKLDLCPGAPAMIGGYGFSGKTISSQSLLVSVALGKSAWGWFPTKAGPVVHFDYEQGHRLTCERYQRLARAMVEDPRELAGKLRVCIHPRTYLDGSEAEDFYVRRTEGVQLALVDSFRAAAPSGVENDSAVRRHLDLLARVSERTGCTMLVIHHARKQKTEEKGKRLDPVAALRGSGSIFDACSSVLVLDGSEKGAPAIVHHTKARSSGITEPLFALAVEDVAIGADPRAGIRVSYRAIEAIEAQRDAAHVRARMALEAKIARIVASEPGISRDRAAREAAGRKATALGAIDDLLELGNLRGERRGRSLHLFPSSPTLVPSFPPKGGGTRNDVAFPVPGTNGNDGTNACMGEA